MRTTYDFAPLWRSTIGFDRLFDLVDAAQQQTGTEDNYTPCNVERLGEDRYQISLAGTTKDARWASTAQPTYIHSLRCTAK